MSIKLKDTVLENINSANKLTSSAGGTTQPIYFKDGVPTNCTYTLGKSVPSDAKFTDTNTTYSQATSSTLGLVKIGYSTSGKNYAVQLNSSGQMYVNVPWTDTDTNTDTKNTAGSTDSSSKLFLIGATSQAANPQTYSHNTAYVGTDGCLYSNSTKVSVEGHTHSYASSSHSHNFNQITDAPNVYLNAGTVTRRVLIQNTKNSQGYISRATIGLTNAANQFSPVFIGVGTNDRGTTFTDYYFAVGGSISDSKGNTYLSTANWSTYCAAKSHTHNYAGSSSAGGAATSANKLSTARTISLTGSVTGSGSFDGSGNLSITTTTNHSHSGYASSSHTHNYAGSSSPGGAATSALTISASAPQLAAAGESNNINIVNNANSSITTNSPESLAAITKAIRFRWYNDYWEIGSIRGSSNKSIGFGFTINNNNLRFRITSDAAYVGSSTVLHTGNWSTYCAAKSHNHSAVLDIGNSTSTTFAYSKAGLNYSDYTWLAGWNGYELRAVNKSQFAQASHTHSGYMTTSSPTGSGTLMMNGSNSRGSYPAVKWHIGNVNWAQIIMNGSGELEFRGGASQDTSYITARMGACVCTSLYVGGEQITFTT